MLPREPRIISGYRQAEVQCPRSTASIGCRTLSTLESECHYPGRCRSRCLFPGRLRYDGMSPSGGRPVSFNDLPWVERQPALRTTRLHLICHELRAVVTAQPFRFAPGLLRPKPRSTLEIALIRETQPQSLPQPSVDCRTHFQTIVYSPLGCMKISPCPPWAF